MKRLRLHLATALLALLGILPGSLSQTYSASQNPYDKKAADLRERFAASSVPGKAALLVREYALRDYVTDSAAITNWFSAVTEDATTDPLVSSKAQAYLSRIRRDEGDLVSPAVEDDSTDKLLELARRDVESQPQSAEALDVLGLLESDAGSPDAHDHFELAARMVPTADRWLRVASTCGDSTCAFAALNAALTAAQDAPDVLGRLSEYYAARGQWLKARTLLERAIAAAPDDFLFRVRQVDFDLAAGSNADALRALRKLDAEYSNVTWVQIEAASRYERLGLLDRAVVLDEAALKHAFQNTRLRDALARLYATQTQTAKLRALLSDTVKLQPADEQAATMLAELSGDYGSVDSKQSAEAFVDRDRAYVVNAAELAAKTRSGPPADTSSAVELADIRVERLASNGLSTVRVQQLTYIATSQGARDQATRTITFAPAAQRVEVVHARVFKADGRIMNADVSTDSAPTDAVSAMYYDTRTRTVRYPALEKGDVVELDYRLVPTAADNPYGKYFGELETFGSSLPRKLQRYVVVAPSELPLHVVAERLPQGVESNSGSEHVYTWEMRDLAPLPTEPKGPATTEIAPYVAVSTFSDWEQVGKWYAQLIAPQFKLDASLRDVLAKVTSDKTTDEEKIRAIHHFVLRNTHYVALEFGVYSYKPYPVSQVYARRFGDCKDKASLMIALLRAAGIEADLALVRTRRLGDVAPGATSISIFNHAVAYLPKYNLWLDGTAEYAGSHELPIDDQGAQALTVSLDGDAQLRRIPMTLPMENYTHRQVRAEIEPDGKIQFTGSAYTRGEDAPGLRREYEVTERQRANFRNRLAEVLPAVKLDSVEVNGAHDLESDVIVNFSGDLDNNAGKKQVTLSPSWMMRSYVKNLAPLTSRNEDLVLPAPWTTEEELHFVLPNGSRVELVPQDTNIETPFGMASVRYLKQGNELVVKTSVQFRKLRIAPAEYASFREFCTQVENAFHSEIRVGL